MLKTKNKEYLFNYKLPYIKGQFDYRYLQILTHICKAIHYTFYKPFSIEGVNKYAEMGYLITPMPSEPYTIIREVIEEIDNHLYEGKRVYATICPATLCLFFDNEVNHERVVKLKDTITWDIPNLPLTITRDNNWDEPI